MSDAATLTPAQSDPSWLGHIRATLRLGVPLIGMQLAQIGLQVTDTVMIGRLGAEDLAAAVLGAQVYFLSFVLTWGFAQALVPLAAAAAARGDTQAVRRATRMGAWAVIAATTVLMPILWGTGTWLLWLGQDPVLAAKAGSYVRIAQWGLFAFALVAVLRGFLSALERTAFVFWATVAAIPVNAAVNYVLIYGSFGAPALGIEGAAIASVVSVSLTLVLMIGFCRRDAMTRGFQLFVRPWRADWPTLGRILVMGAAISATLLAEVGLFAMSALMIGWIGTIPLAAHGIAMSIISVIFMVPLGLSSAATVRAGRALGRRDALGLARASWTVLGLSLGFAALSALLLWIFPVPLIGVFLGPENAQDAALIIAYGVPLLAVAALFQLVDTAQVVLVALLRGLQDIRVPMAIAIVSYWGVGVPAGSVLAFPLGLGGVGVWLGLLIGLTAAALARALRYRRVAPRSTA